jgi:formylglycine-generating enzyme required for sulfatase activity
MAQADTTLKNVKGEIPEDLRKVGLFFQSIEKKDYPVIRSALENGMSPDMFCSNDATILLMACCNCDVELVKLLLEFNANVELAGAEDYPLNSMPVSCAFREKSLDIVEMLLEKGANPNVCPPGYGGVYYLVDYLCDKSDSFYGNDKEKGRRWFKAFLNAPKPPTLVNGSGPTINNAFKAGVEDEFVFLLLDKYDSFPEESDVIATALFYEKSDSIVKGLVDKKADVNAVFTIPKYTKIQKLREVIKTRGGQKTTALWLAVEQNRPKIVELLIKNGADVNWKNEQGKTVKELPATEEIREIFQTYGVKVSENASVEKMAAVAMPTENLYVVVDLSGGTEADNYPLRYTNTAPDLNDNTCRTTELWLRRIPKGAFVMGSPIDEVGRYISEPQHDVTLTQDYYIGVFECTQKQWELVMGSNPSIYTGDCRPVETVSYDMIRGPSATAGAGWPMYGHTVDASSFMGLLQAKTGLVFDLPTEAQWEYACRAGTTSAFNSGKNHTSSAQDAVMDEVGRYAMNKSDGKGGFSQHTTVGSYQPNAWGLYDMHGNVYELCLDWYARSYYSISSRKDPTGPIVEMRRTERGGCWRGHVDCCRSACRSSNIPSLGNDALGFRIVFLP